MLVPITRGYQSHLVHIYARPAAGGMFYSAFSIHRVIPGAPGRTPEVHTQTSGVDFVFTTEVGAVDNAEQRARDWIDAHSGQADE